MSSWSLLSFLAKLELALEQKFSTTSFMDITLLFIVFMSSLTPLVNMLIIFFINSLFNSAFKKCWKCHRKSTALSTTINLIIKTAFTVIKSVSNINRNKYNIIHNIHILPTTFQQSYFTYFTLVKLSFQKINVALG